MSSYSKKTKNPKTGKIETAEWLDNYFAPREYGVRFSDGEVYRPGELNTVPLRFIKEKII